MVVTGTMSENHIGIEFADRAHHHLALCQPGSQAAVVDLQHFIFNTYQRGDLFGLTLPANCYGTAHLIVMPRAAVGRSEKLNL